MNPPTWDDLLSGHVARPKRPTPRHHRGRHHWADLRHDSAHTITAALQTARGALKAAIYGTDTPAGGLTLLARLQRQERTS